MKFYALLVVLTTLLFAVAFVEAKGKEYDLSLPARTLFKEWVKDHPEQAKFTSDSEKDARFAIFAENVEKIRDLNAKHASRTKFMINKFAHLSEEEFRDTMLSKKVPNDYIYKQGDSLLPEVSKNKLGDLPKEFDWRKANPPVVTPVKDQGACGSCWAFSSTGNIEGQWALAGNGLVDLSEQQLVDCDHECIEDEPDACDSGCQGGLMENTFTYVLKSGGIEATKTYPYEARNRPCRHNPDNIVAKVDNWTFVPKNPDQMAYYLVNNGPIAIAADASMWQFYYSGVWYLYCGTNLNHAILLVGYGIEKDVLGRQMPYWIVKNSWGKGWGMSGYILIERGNNRCGLQDYPITTFIDKDKKKH